VFLVLAILPWTILGSLNFLDENMMKATLTAMWKKQMNTTQDPADGKYYTYSPNGGSGLYGNLTDRVDTTVYYNSSGISYTRTQFIADSATVDNMNGMNPTNTVTLSYTHSAKTSQSHSVSTSYKSSFNISFKASFLLWGITGDLSTAYNFNYEYDYSASSSYSSSDTITTSQSVPVTVPKGKIYKVLLSANAQQMIVPTSTYTYVVGKSETWFNKPVNGHYNWYMDAGSTFAAIKQFGSSAAGDSWTYGISPQNTDTGMIVTPGFITGANTANFMASVVDVTGLTAEDIKSYENNLSTLPASRLIKQIHV